MKPISLIYVFAFLGILSISNQGCLKEGLQQDTLPKINSVNSENEAEKSVKEDSQSALFNLNVRLFGVEESRGHIKFRQNLDLPKIVTLETKVHGLEPNHEYLLQRAVDLTIDGNCTSNSWLTLGKGLTPQSILTDEDGSGEADLWRSVSSVPSGSVFDIHFQVIDKNSLAVVLTSDCYTYMVR